MTKVSNRCIAVGHCRRLKDSNGSKAPADRLLCGNDLTGPLYTPATDRFRSRRA